MHYVIHCPKFMLAPLHTKTIATFKMSSEVIKCPTIGAASFGQSPYIACYLPIRGVVGHNIDRCISYIVWSDNWKRNTTKSCKSSCPTKQSWRGVWKTRIGGSQTTIRKCTGIAYATNCIQLQSHSSFRHLKETDKHRSLSIRLRHACYKVGGVTWNVALSLAPYSGTLLD